MEEIIRYLAYPALKIGMFAVQIGSGWGVEIFVALIFIGCILACINEFKLNSYNIVSVLLLLAPFGFWFGALSLFTTNAGVGNFILELCALLTVMVIFSAAYKIAFIFGLKGISRYILMPQLWLFLLVIATRLFMPLVEK